MKIGLIARGEDRGLGTLTREFARHMPIERTLLIRPDSSRDAGLAQHRDWFAEDALRTGWTWDLDPTLMRKFLDGLDVVYSAETFYDWRMCDLARELGVRTVCHLMPEYFKHAPGVSNRFPDDLPAPDVWWNPTSWRAEHLPPDVEVVPVPVALDRFTIHDSCTDGSPRWLHVAGSRAASDRNGTRIVMEALRHLRGEHVVIIRSQGEPFYPNGSAGPNVHIESHHRDLADYWDLYSDADALVMPRRYGGLCLPAQEAMGAGLALVMPSVEPQVSTWPIIPIRAPFENRITTSAGSIPICAPDPADLAAQMDHLAAHRDLLRAEQQRARTAAEAISWERLRPVYLDALERALA